MLNLHQLERLLDESEYRQLVNRILANGRATEPSIRQALTHPAILAPVALGLALQRTCELSYGPAELAERIVNRLLDLQLPDGRFGSERSSPRHSIIAMAVALRGLLDYQHQHAFFSPLSLREKAGVRVPQDANRADSPTRATPSSILNPQHSNRSLAAAVERTVGALAAAVVGELAAVSSASGADDAHGDDVVPLRIVAWQLASHRAAAMRIKMPQIAVARLSASSTTHDGQRRSLRKALAA